MSKCFLREGLSTPRVGFSGSGSCGGGYRLSLAEVGTVQLEFISLSQITQDTKYKDLAIRSFNAIIDRAPKISGIYSNYFNTDFRSVGY